MSNAKKTERVTVASRETLLTILETLPGALLVVDDTETIVYANANAQAIIGTAREEVCGTSLWHCAPHLVSTPLYQAVRKTRQTREPTEVAYVSPVTNNWLHVSLTPTDKGLALLFQEQLEPLPLQDALSRNEQLYRELLESVADGVTIVTPEGLVLDINQRPLADAHLRREEAIGKPLTDLPAWSSDPAVQQHLRAAIAQAAQGETVRFEAHIHPRTDLSLDMLMTITCHRDASQQVEYLICAGRDITERKQAEDELRPLVDAIPHFVWIAGPDGSLTYHNHRLIAYMAMTLERAEGDGWLAGVHPDDRQRVRAAWQTSIQTGVPYEVELRLQDGTSGAYRWFLVRGVPQRNAQGTILHWVGTCTDIEDRKRAEQGLKESREHLRVLVETLPQLVWATGPDGLTEDWNQRYADYFQATPEQLRGYGWRQFLHPEEYDHVCAVRNRSLATGEPYAIEYRLREGQTGAYRWFLARGMPVRDEAGQILKWFGTCTDIDEQKRAEQQLKSSRESLRVLAETVPQLVWATRPDGGHEYVNQRWCDYTGLTLEQVESDCWVYLQFIHPEDREGNRAQWQQARDMGDMFEHEARLRNSQTGEYRWFLVRSMPVRDETGQILKWFGTCTDIEDQKRTEQQLKESRESLRVLAETVPQLVWVKRPDGQHEYTNQRWRDYTGLTLEQIQSDRWVHLQFIHPDDQEGHRASFQRALDTGAMFEYEQRLRHAQTGEYRWFLTRAMPMRNEAGQIIKWFGTNTNIEDQKRIEEALRQSQERASVLMNSNIIGIFVDEGEQIVDANDTFLRMTGYTREDLHAGRLNWMHMTPPEYLAQTRQAHQELAAQQSLTPYEKEYVCQDGSRLPVLVCGDVLQHHPFQRIAFVLDNSAPKELEQRKDDFISMASHELKTPLTALKMQTQLVRKRLERQAHHEAATALSKVEGPVKQLERLVGELLDVSKIQAGRLEYIRETVNLDALLHEVADTMQQISTTHTIVVRGATSCTLVGDKDWLGQVFTNLLSNAIKYSPGTETVEMDLSASPETVTIRVRDHGLGIPREQRDKIFERFYRVAGPRQRAIPGLGMGLYIVAEIVRGHGGTITVDSEVGKGSTFTVTFPKKRDA
ncbi:PAS domain S-box protein [Ktedonobacter racemifer]|uniref:histidine kinase n=1 Tax=Ktedonobacter racemifer DSM 44963 TaxID=485913 RepID=D6TC53_KTERA|nr:PAS domain S-box protein [Ktedonobacter racemifer]EFH88089.1 PAS/PAC sensor signal transduction histidine kinase [Ktedonobacter racemifer DSM 44963]